MEIFQSANVDESGQIDETEVMRLVKKLNNGLATTRIQHKLKVNSDTIQLRGICFAVCASHSNAVVLQEIILNDPGDNKRKRLNSEEFINMFKEISTRPEIYFLLIRSVCFDFPASYCW